MTVGKKNGDLRLSTTVVRKDDVLKVLIHRNRNGLLFVFSIGVQGILLVVKENGGFALLDG